MPGQKIDYWNSSCKRIREFSLIHIATFVAVFVVVVVVFVVVVAAAAAAGVVVILI